MSRKRTWLYAAVLFLLVATVLVTQVSWLLQSATIEESFLNQRVNMALCSAMDVLSRDRGLCSNVESCVSNGGGKFEITFNQQEKLKIDSVIDQHLLFYNISVPFRTTLSPYIHDSTRTPLEASQVLLYPKKERGQNVLVNIAIPSKAELVRSQIGGTFLLSILVLILLIGIFTSTVRALVKEKKIRTMTVDFINTMAHDLKTPISNISFAVALLNRDANKDNAPAKQFISIIEAETLRLKERAARILGVASVDAVLETSADQSDIEVHQLINDLIDSLDLRLRQGSVIVEKDLHATRTLVRGNRFQLYSAITNIVDNAICYSGNGSLIEVRTHNEPGSIQIEVKDNGPGIAGSEQELVFTRAYRGRGAKTSEGFGLGLYIAKTSVENNGGSVTLTSDGVSGSSFIVTLPLQS